MTYSKKQTFSLSCLLLVLPVLMFARVSASAAAVPQEGSGAQAPSAVEPISGSVVPRLIRFSGIVKDAEGKPATGSVQLTFSLYQFHDGGSPLWVETQSARLDSQGRYTVLLGAASPDGLPLDVFANGAARWLGVQPALPGIGEQPKVLLVGVPYALKAADAETLAGKPASAFVTTEMLGGPGSASPASAMSMSTGTQASSPTLATSRVRQEASRVGPLTACGNVTADGTATANFVTKFTAPCVIHQSAIFESSGKVGIGNTSPAGTLDVSGNAFVRGTLNLNQTTSSSVGVINIGSSPFMHACCPSASGNTFVGAKAGNFSTTGGQNTAIGSFALFHNASGIDNTAVGLNALIANTSGSLNTATGVGALNSNTFGHDNTASGFNALQSNSTGFFNTASGEAALITNVTGSKNTALGYDADVTSNNLINATAIGAFATVGESNALVLGCTNCQSGTSPPNVGIGTANPNAKLDIVVPNTGIQNLVFFGDTVGGSGDVAKIVYNANTSPFPLVLSLTRNRPLFIQGGNVGIGTFFPDNLLTVNGSADKPGGGSWGTFSDGRLKTVKTTYDAGLEAILKLTPVRYRYKEQNAMGINDDQEHVGFVAQEVEKVIPEAVTRDNRGYLLVNNDPIIWTMLNAIKQQQAEIRTLTRSAHEKDVRIQKLTEQAQQSQKLKRQMVVLEGRLAQVEIKSGDNLAAAVLVAHAASK